MSTRQQGTVLFTGILFLVATTVVIQLSAANRIDGSSIERRGANTRARCCRFNHSSLRQRRPAAICLPV